MERSSSSSSSSRDSSPSRRSSLDGQNQQIEQQPSGSSFSSSGQISSLTRYWWNNTSSTTEQSTFSAQEMRREVSASAEVPKSKRVKGNEVTKGTPLSDRMTDRTYWQLYSDLTNLARTTAQLEKTYQATAQPSLEQLQELGDAYSKYLQAFIPAIQERVDRRDEIQTKQTYYEMLKLYDEELINERSAIDTRERNIKSIQGSIIANLRTNQVKEHTSANEKSRVRIEALLSSRKSILEQISAQGIALDFLQSQESSLSGEIDQLEDQQEHATARLKEIHKKQQEISQILSLTPYDNLTSQIFGPNMNYGPYEVNRTTLTPNMGNLTLPDFSIGEDTSFASLTNLLERDDIFNISFDEFTQQLSTLNRSQVTTETILDTPTIQVQDTSQHGTSETRGTSTNKGKRRQTKQDILAEGDVELAWRHQIEIYQDELEQNNRNRVAEVPQEEAFAALRPELEFIESYFDDYLENLSYEVNGLYQGNEPTQSTSYGDVGNASTFPSTNEIPQNQKTPEHSESESITESMLNFFDEGDIANRAPEQALNRIPWANNELQTLAEMYTRVKKTSLLSTDSNSQAVKITTKLKSEGLRDGDYRIIQKILKSKWKNNELKEKEYNYIRDKVYKQSDKGKSKTSEIQGRYNKSNKGKSKTSEIQERYRKSDKGKATWKTYRESDKGKATKVRYRKSDKGMAAKERAIRKATDAEIMLNYQENVIILDEENFEKTASSSSEESEHDEK